jgi:sigma-B regulation protein RsbU (phosphoserine phosphatase)
MVLEADPAVIIDGKVANQARILVVDDQGDVREALRLLLKGAGFAIETAASPEEALAAAGNGAYDLIVVDMNFTRDTTSGEEGLRLVDSLRAQRPGVSVIAMTGWSTIELAVEAMQRGACDFIPKPWDNRRFLSVIQKHLNAPKHPGATQSGRALDAELAIARNVQMKLLPPPHFSACGLDCECETLPAREIGGDFYDFLEADPGTAAFLLADVSGKGIGAALLAANLQATIRGQRALANSPARLLERVNQLFFEFTPPEHFATLFYGVYDEATGIVRYVSCGHPSAVLLRANGAFELLDAGATVLGAFQNLKFEECSVEMRTGDRLVLFSDGFSEAQMDAMTEEMSDRWAVETILSLASSRKSGLAGALASRAASGSEQADDITVMDVRVV